MLQSTVRQYFIAWRGMPGEHLFPIFVKSAGEARRYGRLPRLCC